MAIQSSPVPIDGRVRTAHDTPLHPLHKALDPRHATLNSPVRLLARQLGHFLAPRSMAKGVSYLGEEVFQCFSLPFLGERPIFFAAKIVNVAMRTFFTTMCPSLLVRDDLYGALKSACRIEHRVAVIRIP